VPGRAAGASGAPPRRGPCPKVLRHLRDPLGTCLGKPHDYACGLGGPPKGAPAHYSIE